MSLKFETVLYSFAILLLALISLPDGNKRNQQDAPQAVVRSVEQTSINIAVAEASGKTEEILTAEATDSNNPDDNF